MVIQRPDLDGLRLRQPGADELWLVFHGRRHRIGETAVHDALWSGTEGVVDFHDLHTIEPGEDLAPDACLVRADGDLGIHLLTRFNGEVRSLLVKDYESLVDFGFDEAKVHDVPPLLIHGVPAGRPLISARSRGLVPA